MIIVELFPIKIKFNIETIFILGSAIAFDLIGIALICFGLDDLGILDTVGVLIFDSWAIHKSLSPPSGRRGRRRGKNKKVKNILKRMLGSSIAEAIPYLGALPFWSYNIYMILKDQIEDEEMAVYDQQMEEIEAREAEEMAQEEDDE
jgi:hypothetical protein